MSDKLLDHAKRRAALLHMSAAWGVCEDGLLIQQLIARIEATETPDSEGEGE
jgi:hypothetical protein